MEVVGLLDQLTAEVPESQAAELSWPQSLRAERCLTQGWGWYGGSPS